MAGSVEPLFQPPESSLLLESPLLPPCSAIGSLPGFCSYPVPSPMYQSFWVNRTSSLVCLSLGAGPEVPSAPACMAMVRPHTSYHCRRTLHTCHKGFGGRGPHPGIPGPRGHLVLAMATTLQPTGPPDTDLCTRVTVDLVLDCKSRRAPSTSCLWPMTKASLKPQISSTTQKQAAALAWGPTGQLRASPSLPDLQQSPALGPIGSTSCATQMWVYTAWEWPWKQLLLLSFCWLAVTMVEGREGMFF